MSDDDVLNFHLVEGGRWLLVANHSGRIAYHDLDEEEITEKTLIPEQLNPRLKLLNDTHVLMNIDVDVDARFLTFNLGICFRRSDVSLLQVWRVCLEVDSHGRGLGLKAEKLASFPRELHLFVSFSLLGKFVSYAVPTQGRFPPYVAIVDWAKAQSHCESEEENRLYRKRVIHLTYDPVQIRLIPGRRLIITFKFPAYVRLYNLHSADTTTLSLPISTNAYDTAHAWSAHLAGVNQRSLSRPFLHTKCGTVRLITSSDNAIYGIIIPFDPDPRDPENYAQVVKLMKCFPGLSNWSPSFGYNHALVRNTTHIVTLNYSWPGDPDFKPPTMSIKKSSYESWTMHDTDMDERSGREVFSPSVGKEIIVVDIGLRGLVR
ncbi:hypothetical protein BDZ97DRAFT_1811435 [Flammula alnicola]|nr:hypothetical protein BDZ97DRAFT_1811435 [Flammula alnicola]